MNQVNQIKEMNQANYSWVYGKLADQASKDLFVDLLCSRALPEKESLKAAPYDIQEKPIPDCDVSVVRLEAAEGISSAAAVLAQKDLIKKGLCGVSLYINPALPDLWEIPHLAEYMHSGCRLYLRREMHSSCSRTVLYILPKTDAVQRRTPMQGKRVVAIAPFERPWSNVELVKDCGLIPYLLYKRHGCEVRMTGAPGENYSYASLVKGIKLEFLPDGSIESKLRYIEQNAGQIDLLILRGPYPHNVDVSLCYKQKNPLGKIYAALDANAAWMDHMTQWKQPRFQEFMNQCDVIATSGYAAARYLNEKWPWKIEHIPNGYYDFNDTNTPPSFAEKENMILTVSRLGTKQKAVHVLLEAFAEAAEELPGWKLRMAGSIEPEFNQYIDSYFECYPHLKNRIEFAGVIQDRKRLFQEYRRAKIFALSSIVEGGTPNVIAEALHGGCVIAAARFDASEEASAWGKCGRIADVGDVRSFSHILVELAQSEELEEMSKTAYQYSKEHFDMERITDRLYGLIAGECDV